MNNHSNKRFLSTPIGAIIALLSILLVSNAITLVSAIVTPDTYRSDAQSLLYAVKSQDYMDMRREFSKYTAEEIAANETLTECYNVALYFENSVYYHAFAGTDAVRAERYLAAATENKANMGTLSYVAGDIDQLFMAKPVVTAADEAEDN